MGLSSIFIFRKIMVRNIFSAGKRRWIPQGASSTTGPGGPGSYPPGTPPKSEGDNRVASSTSSTPEARVKVNYFFYIHRALDKRELLMIIFSYFS